MSIKLAKILGIAIGGLALAGFFVDRFLFGFMNTDLALDVLRLVLAAYLLYAGFVASNRAVASIALIVTGILYVGLGVAGMIDSEVGGLLPSGLTGLDVAFHIIVGLAVAWVGFRENKQVEVRM